MKSITCFLVLLCFVTSVSGQVSFGEPVKINNDWKFQKGDMKDAASPGFNDSGWRRVDLPHDWSVEGPLSPTLASATGYLPGGIAWYRKNINIPVNRNEQKVFVYFEGVYRNGEVFINGTYVGMRPNGFISCLYEITPYIRFGENNLIAVRVDHGKSVDSRWYTGSGIYRDVYLVYADSIHIVPWGVYYTTHELNDKQSAVSVQTSLTNATPCQTIVLVEQQLTDKENKIVSKSSRKVTLPAIGKDTLLQELKVNQPHRWSPEDPYLYQLKTSVFSGGKLIDQARVGVGIRTLGFDADKGFSINGKSLKVKGVCLHHDAGCLGSAVPREVWERRLAILKSVGCNAIRTSHNPQAPGLYDLCDEMGFLILDEAFDEWEFPKKKWIEGWNVGIPGFEGSSEFFKVWGETDLRDMVLRDRNHPSVFMWSIGNEVDYPNDPYSHPILNKEGIQQQHTAGYLPDHPNAERLGTIAQSLAAVVRKYDHSRPVTAGLAGPVMSNETAYPGALDVVGYNYSENRYAMDHKKYPGRILYGSENGQSYEAWKAVRDNDYIFGQFLWTGIDYLGESHAWPSRGFTSGLLDLAGYKKPRAWFRESLWSDNPMIYIGTFHKDRKSRGSASEPFPLWNFNAGDTIQIVCYTNCRQAQLLLNGQNTGVQKEFDNEKGYITWEIPFQPGKLEAIGYISGHEAARYSVETSKRPYAIRAVTMNAEIPAENGVAQIEIQIVDEDGRPVFLSDDEIICLTDGPVKLLGIEAGNSTDMGNYTDNRQRVFQGKMIAYIQAIGKKGKAGVVFESPWLKSAAVELRIE